MLFMSLDQSEIVVQPSAMKQKRVWRSWKSQFAEPTHSPTSQSSTEVAGAGASSDNVQNSIGSIDPTWHDSSTLIASVHFRVFLFSWVFLWFSSFFFSLGFFSTVKKQNLNKRRPRLWVRISCSGQFREPRSWGNTPLFGNPRSAKSVTLNSLMFLILSFLYCRNCWTR